MKIGLWGMPQTEEGWVQVWELIERLDDRDIDLYGGPSLSEAFFQHQRDALSPASIGALYACDEKPLALAADLLVLWGGTEALLRRLRLIFRHGPIVLLVGEGKGFPAIGEEELTEAVGQLLGGKGVLDSRMLLGAGLNPEKESPGGKEKRSLEPNQEDVSNSNEGYVGAEEVVFRRSENDALLRIDLSVNDRPLTSYEADGLVISTPTGSAARSLSAGGPLVVPGTDGLLVTPVASHTLATRPMLVPGASIVEAHVYSRSGRAFFRVDRSTCLIENGDTITIRQESGDLRLAVPAGKGNENHRDTNCRPTFENTNSAAEGSGEQIGKTERLGLAPVSTADRLRESVSFPRCRTARNPASPEDCLGGRVSPWHRG